MGAMVHSVFSPLGEGGGAGEEAMGARQGCVGFGYLVSPLGPPPPAVLAAAATAATVAAAAVVHSLSLSLPLPLSLSLPLPLSLSLYLPPFSPFFLSRSRSRSLSLAFVSSLSLSLSLSSHLLRLCSTRLSTVLLVFLTKDPLNTSAVITSRHPSRVARLPRQTHPQPSALRLHGAHRPSRPTSHHLAPPRSHSSSQFLTFRSTFPSGREPGTA